MFLLVFYFSWPVLQFYLFFFFSAFMTLACCFHDFHFSWIFFCLLKYILK